MGELEDRISAVLGDPRQMEEITRLAQSFLGGESEAAEPAPAAPDTAMLGKLGKLLGSSAAPSRNQALLEAMKPYFSDRRQQKIDRALKLAKLARLAELAMEAGGEGDA